MTQRACYRCGQPTLLDNGPPVCADCQHQRDARLARADRAAEARRAHLQSSGTRPTAAAILKRARREARQRFGQIREPTRPRWWEE
jgi:uncharacterized Zn finger protein (UPF0148 family)